MNEKLGEICPKTPEEEGEIIELDDTTQDEAENPEEIEIEEIVDSDEEVSRDVICKVSFSSKENYKCFKDVVRKCIGNAIDADFEESEETNELTVTKVPELSFLIDATPVAEKVKIPSYKRSSKDIFNGEIETLPEESLMACQKVTNPNVCFNCSSTEHSIKDCPEEKDINRIRKAKKEMMAKKDSHKLTRYHVDANQAYADLEPGKISPELSKALGLKKKELPSFFFRMRLFGYPEGWLKAAEIHDSGISMITGANEDATKVSSTDADSLRYDESKIISFPGFNEDPGDEYHDDFKYFNVPKWNKRYSREVFIENLGNKVIQSSNIPKRAKMEFPSNAEEDDQSMDEEESHEVNGNETMEETSSPKPSVDCNKEIPQTPDSKKNSISVDLGTPLLKFSPYDSLPPGSNFQVGVSDVIAFENLPDSTGSYEKMEKIIKKVRNEVKRLNSC